MFYPLQTIIKRYDTYTINRQQCKQKTNQQNIFSAIIKHASKTTFGQEHWLHKDTSYQEFIQQVPIRDYDQIKPWIEQSKTQANILRPEKIQRFAASSWTTSAKKHIPLTTTSIQTTNKAGIDAFRMLISTNPKIRPLFLHSWPLGWSIQQVQEDGTTIADVSAHIIQTTPPIHKRYLFPEKTLLIADRKQKRQTFGEQLDPNKNTLLLWVTSRIVEMGEYIQKHYPQKREKLLKNIQAVVRWWVSVKPFIQKFKQRKIPKHMGVYNASEWFFGYQNIRDFDNTNGDAPYILTSNHGIFYEFVATNNDNFDQNNQLKPTAKAKKLHDITQEDIDNKQKFALIITSNTWLYRYMIGDVIRFVDRRLHFVIEWRTKQSLNLKGEELMIDHTENAVAQANNKYNTHIRYYSIWPDHKDNPSRHHRVIEGLDNKIAANRLQYVDSKLQEYNADYKAKRANDILLQSPSYDIVPTGTFHTRLGQNKKLWWQSKTVKLSEDTKTIDALRQIWKI